ncbi:hypothetical protein CONPUDRAFT_80199, partial [Coniophora puteana RWD-64-598 SS2]
MSHLTHATLSLHTPSTGSSCLTSFTMTPYTRAQDDPHTQSSSAHRLTSHSSGLLSTGPHSRRQQGVCPVLEWAMALLVSFLARLL